METRKSVELEQLAGLHVLDGVDMDSEKVRTWGENFEDCCVVRFRLNGVVYVAVEDPDDGYRSCMRDIYIDDKAVIKNTFPMARVSAVYKEEMSYGKADKVEFYDIETGLLVLEIGTDNTDDYYPSFVGSFHPENMIINADRNT